MREKALLALALLFSVSAKGEHQSSQETLNLVVPEGKPQGAEETQPQLVAAEGVRRVVKRAKTCIYTIAYNELTHVDAYMAAAKGADVVSVADLGSLDGTAEALKEAGAQVHRISVRPFRFDVARNTALNLLPADCDLCLSFDMDEYVQPGWVEAVQQAWQESGGKVTAMRYNYIWSWKADGVTPDLRFVAQKIHGRFDYMWRDPAHELPYWTGPPEDERVVEVPGLELHHHALPDKITRLGYLNLLKLGVEEEPMNPRRAHYYGRELMFARRWAEAIAELERHVAMPAADKFLEEKAASLRFIAQCYLKQGLKREAQQAALRNLAVWDLTREPWMEVARVAQAVEDWPTVVWAASKALSITEISPLSRWPTRADSWGAEPHDLLALGLYYSGSYDKALEQGYKALELDPSNERIQKNIDFYKAKVKVPACP